MHLYTSDIREQFKTLLANKKFTTVNREGSMTSLVGNTTIEIVGASFIADEESIFGEVNHDYVAREEAWYNSMSLNVNDIPGGAPAMWKAVADRNGFINSNYGALIFSNENFRVFRFSKNKEKTSSDGHWACSQFDGNINVAESQYDAVLYELKKNPSSRRATMIYTRPSIWLDFDLDGRSDFICTNAVGYVIRNGAIHANVQMRSNDAWAGYRNDRAWQLHVLSKLANDLNVDIGNIYWTVTSLHLYARNYYLVDHFAKTGEISISKIKYAEQHPGSPYI